MRLHGPVESTRRILAYVEERLAQRLLTPPGDEPATEDAVEPRIDPLSFNLHALNEHADAARPLPLETHRGGLTGRLVLAAKSAFRSAGQVFINEALGRQTVFNGHVRDSYAQLSAEVMALRSRLEALEHPAPPPKPKAAPRRRAKS
ncbi:MAG: hypothetical protein JNG84_07770 [Archangium sp.]|nr:hypothetical protein [Archangium sp.]